MWWWTDHYSSLPSELAQQQFNLQYPDFSSFQDSWLGSAKNTKKHLGVAGEPLQYLFDALTANNPTLWDAMRQSQSWLQPDVMRMGA